MVRRSCFVSGGTKRVLFTMSCWNLAIPRAIGISATIDSFEPCIARKTAGIGAKTWKSYFSSWQRSASCRKSRKKIFGNAQMRCFTTPAVFFGHCSWLLVVPKDAARFGKSPVHFFRRNRKLAPKLDRLQRRVIFSRWNSKIVWEIGKSSSRWTILN